ncbi:hypothetical protein BKP37_15695 [Anaerobacillus alkalilacustris]|uniref:YhaN AAA domain-containing protein n=1 Tax=Anaerobacillus alkalilacustris TaxID=393763 RepID=A0A1S2LIU2_9BACI|nr:AAA family ATPase [Anaerobacillus alkalilacustris]OIJ11395.1 hypothetical protein BKP37_15695 [Anaerobacillus alkalilacustris]
MKLVKLHIYGFGRFQDCQIEFSKGPIHSFLGDNEAGKSTIMAFIRCILFGFPTKLQSEIRYEPRLGGRYGGSIEIDTQRYGKVTVERVRGKAVGDVKVYFSNGNIGREEALKHVLGGLDRNHFLGIYSFGLTDLQNIEQLDSEEFNRFLYGVGISGMHSLLEIEKKTDKALQELYKPSGRKPVINQHLKKVSNIEDKVNTWKNKLSKHEILVNEKVSLTENLQTLTDKKMNLNKKLRYFEKLQSITPIVLDIKMYENRVQQLPVSEPFPENGMQRFEKLKDHCLLVEAETSEVKERLEQIDGELAKLHIREDLTEIEGAIANVREIGKIYESKHEEKGLLIQQLRFEQKEYEVMKEKLGIESVDVFSFDTSFLAEQKLEKLIDEEVTLKQQEKLLQTQLKQSQDILEEKEIQVDKLTVQLLDDGERKELEKKRSEQRSELELQQEIHYIDDSMQQITSQLHLFSQPKNSYKLFFIIGTCIVFLALIYFFISHNWYVSISLISLAIGILVAFKRNPNNIYAEGVKNMHNQREQLSKRRQKLELKLEAIRREESPVNDILKKDDQIREQLFLKELQLKEVNEGYEKVCKEFDKWEQAYGKFRDELQGWVTNYHYPNGLAASNYLKLLKMLEQMKKKCREITQLNDKLVIINKDIEAMLCKVQELCQSFKIPYNKDQHRQIIERLSILLKQEKEREKRYIRYKDQKDELTEKYKTLNLRAEHYQQEIQKLFNAAITNTEEEFLRKGNAWNENRELLVQLRVLKSQLIPIVDTDEKLEQLEGDVIQYRNILEEEIHMLEGQIKTCWEKEKNLHERSAQIDIELKELEDGSSYSNSLHNFENEKGILKEETKKWAFHRTVQLVIGEAKAIYEKERQPLVLKEANKFFSFMTNGEYKKLYAPIGEQKFIVERLDGLRFEPNELSQGTKEQLYLSVRLALATVHSKEDSYPIFIDDIFVNFDSKRRLQSISLIKEMSKKHQIIFFTCHPFMTSELSTNYYSLSNS